MSQLDQQLEIAARIIFDASYVIALVGAGVSKESGIPTFRGGDGLWDKLGEPPMDGYQRLLEDPVTFFAERELAATMNNVKLLWCNAKAASETATAADIEDNMKPCLRPMRRISRVAGIVVLAVANTIMVTGTVASAWLPASLEPIMPPSVTITIVPVAEISWQPVRMIRLRSGIQSWFRNQWVTRRHILTYIRVRVSVLHPYEN